MGLKKILEIIMKQNIYLSVVVPMFNEEGNTTSLHQEILTTLEKMQTSFEIIFVNDGSSDGTAQELQTLSPLTVITFRKNFGQTAALDAGFKHARGKYIIAMDGDGQNDPADIPKLVTYLEEHNLDVVSGWRKNRQDNKNKRFVSHVANKLRKFLINDGIHDSGCTLKIYRKECFDHVDLYGEMHRFIPAILKIKGFSVGEIVVNHRSRIAGMTKYTWKRGIKGFLDMVSVWFWQKFANRPLHLFGGTGLFFIAVGIILLAISLMQKIFYGVDMTNTMLSFIAIFLLFGGGNLFVFGLLADILSKTYFSLTRDVSYIIKDIHVQ